MVGPDTHHSTVYKFIVRSESGFGCDNKFGRAASVAVYLQREVYQYHFGGTGFPIVQ